MSRLRLRGGRILDPSIARDEISDLYLVDGVVAGPDGGGWRDLDCTGQWLMPGLIDLHAHMAGPDDASLAARSGFVHVMCTADSAVVGQAGLASVRVAPLTVDMRGDSLAGVGAEAASAVLSDGASLIADAHLLRSAMDYAAGFGVLIMLRPGEPALECGPIGEGAASVLLGLPGSPGQGEAIGVWRAVQLADLTGCRVHLTHLWSRQGVEALRAARAAGSTVTGSTTLHQFVLAGSPRIDHRGRFSLSAPIGDANDRLALADGLGDGVLIGVATDHRRLPWASDTEPLQHAPAGATGFGSAVSALKDVLKPLDAVRALTVGPAALLGLESTLRVGSRPAVVRFAPDVLWNGADAGRTPLADTSLRGRVVEVIDPAHGS
jgi:dihydroorotase